MFGDGVWKPEMGQRQFVLFGIAGVVALVIGMTVAALNDSLTYYLYPNEAVARRTDFPDGERFRLAGRVVPGSVAEEGEDLRFDVTDGSATIDVLLTGTPPALFNEDVPVLVEGAWSGDEFLGDEVFVRHDENYEIPEEGNYPDQ